MAVEIREEILELPTYVWGSPDPNPPFQREGSWSIYPYPLLDEIGEDSRVVRYRALVVENEHLRVTVLPELGGHLHSARDKATGEEIFYRNNVVKPGLIALRGAWISGGVEWNFPRGHTVTTVSPVDARMVEEEDGSGVIWVGNVEQVFRMSWAVGIRLRPGSSRIETEVRLSNRTSLPHPYYFWANAAVPASDDMRLIYPGTRVRTWGASYEWPVHEGRDLARYTAFEHSNDVFLQDSLEDFFGVYYEARDFGVVHVADVHDSFGKKFFTWGTAEHGRVWSAALSDRDGPYCEIQSGRYVDQTTWRLMPPHWTEHWREWWYPVARIGGFSWANERAAVRLGRREGAVECGVVVTERIPEARVVLAEGERVVKEERADLAPGRGFRCELPQAGGGVTLRVLDGEGREVIAYEEEQRPRTIRLREAEKREATTPGETLRRALRAEESGGFDEAWELYEKALMMDPACEEAALALGRMAVERKPSQAVARLEAVAAAQPQSAAAAYYLGLALARAGREEEAEVELWRAAQRPEFAHAARVELGRLLMRRAEWRRAAEVLREGLGYDGKEAKARVLLAAALRQSGEASAGRDQAAAALAEAPTERLAFAELHFCLLEMERPRLAARRLRELRELVPQEPDPWLEVALDYTGAGLYEEAAHLLDWAAARIGPVKRDPLGQYLLAHAYRKLGRSEEAERAQRRAAELSPHLVFPHHWELETVLREAAGGSGEGRARHYLGDLLYGQGRREEALAEWETAAAKGEDLSVLRRNLALALRKVEGNLDRAEEELRRAVSLQPDDLRLYLELNQVLTAKGAPASERLAALDAAPEALQRRGAIAALQTSCCLELEQWDRAVDILRTHTFHRWEMEFRMRGVYVGAYLGRGIERFDRGDLQGARADFEQALEYPMNLRIGKPARTSDARAAWCAGIASEALGDTSAAWAYWEAAAAEDHHDPGKEPAVYRALSLGKLGRMEESKAALQACLEEAQKVVEAAPEEAGARVSLGLVLKGMGRTEEAEVELRKALELDPGDRRAKRLLERPIIL